MKIDKNLNILLVGLGLIGGSYAMALSKQGYKVCAIEKNPNSLKYAIDNKLILGGSTEVDKELIEASDVIIFALYPTTFIKWVEEHAHLIKAGTIVTDVTGVKRCLLDDIQNKMPENVEYIAAHPMAGRECLGVENATDEIFKMANYIVVPTEKNTREAIEFCMNLGETLGFKNISCLTQDEHDKMIAFLSQLAHVLAVVLMCANDDEGLEKYTGDSFRDLTRIGKINDEIWSELFLLNKDMLVDEMDAFKERFDEIYDYIKNEDREGIRNMMRISTARRSKFDKPKKIEE